MAMRSLLSRCLIGISLLLALQAVPAQVVGGGGTGGGGTGGGGTGGGGTGGGTTGDWHITCWTDGYTRVHTVAADGTQSDTGQMPWTPQTESDGNGSGGGIQVKIPSMGSAWARATGTVHVHFVWVNPNQPAPDRQWIQVAAGAHWGGNQNCSGAVDDAFGDPIQSFQYGENENGTHIIQKQVSNGEFTVSYHVNGFVMGFQGGLMNCSSAVSVSPTTRWINLDFVGASGHYMKHLTGGTAYFDVPSNLVQGQTMRFTFPEALPVPVPRPNDDINVVLDIDYGLTAVDFNENTWDYSQGPPPHEFPLYYQGYTVADFGQDHFQYGGARVQNIGWDLPDYQGTYTIPTTFGVYNKPWFAAEYFPKQYHEADGNATDTVTFEYKWADGVQGKATLNVHFHPNGDGEFAIGNGTYGYRWPNDPETPFEFTTHEEWSATGIQSQMVVYTHPPIDKEYVTGGFEILVGFLGLIEPLGEAVELIACVAGIALNISYPGDNTQPLNRDGFADADANGRVSPPNWKDLWHPSPYDTDPLAHAKWKAKYKAGEIVKYYVADGWDSTGYTGQKLTPKRHREDMFESRRLYWYWFPDL